MIHRHRTKDSQRKVTPPGPTYMSNDQVASYLKDLRANRPPRPSGSRPLPSPRVSVPAPGEDLPPRAASALSMSRRTEVLTDQPAADPYPRSASAMSHSRNISEVSVGSSTGRPLVQQPETHFVQGNLSPTASIASRFGTVATSAMYRESGQRWMERQEARSLRDALEQMDLQDEHRLHGAAQDEATRLVWEHRNPGVPYKNPHAAYRNPDLQGSNRFRQHLEKGSHARSQSMGGYGDLYLDSRGHRSSSESSGSPPSPDGYNEASSTNGHRKKSKVNFALPAQDPSAGYRETATRSRTVSGDTSKGVFRNPEDYIYEEPEEGNGETNTRSTAPPPSALRVKPRNSLPQGARPLPPHTRTFPIDQKLSKVDIHKNPPSQSRNPLYTANHSTPPLSESKEDDVPRKNGIEIRGDDIRAATSMKLKDRSAKLPMPSAVSDRPGQPIVSFDPSWKPQEEQHSDPSVPTINVIQTPNVPTINVSGEPDDQTPSISISSPEEISDQTPKISVSAPDESSNGTRPLPDLAKHRFSKATDPKRMTPTSQSKWYSPFTRTGVPTATCTHCTLPISGRIVTAAGSRFHPECFTCHHCGTGLECVAFYQEPDAKREERLAKAASGDEEAECLRFYCHLDFHELFSPRCKSCKTPIEGEVIVACGAEWHVGHFFCAECGDPFNQETPFVENDGFAWCLRCHSRRTASRCLGCKQPVLDEVVVTALGGQWHDRCFVCHECGGGFGSEGRFFVKEGEPKRTAKGRIIGGPVQLAVCERCESIRLKA